MTSLLDRPDTRPVPTRRRRRTPRIVALVLAAALAASGAGVAVHRVRTADLTRRYLGSDGWPVTGQAAYRLDGALRSSPDQQSVPIASLAKVMTAFVTLRALPLRDDEQGPSWTMTADDVRDYEQRRARDESVVRVVAGERLTERQALTALLLPSANNVAALLARHVAGTPDRFVARMNATAHMLGMRHTRYTDPSGYSAGTVSTAADQTLLAAAVAGDDVVSAIAAQSEAVLPVAGTVHNTDVLLGVDGFVGTKTGSDDAAGGCFMFRTYRVVRGQIVDVVGVVLGQRGRHDVTAGLTAARQLADRLGPAASA